MPLQNRFFITRADRDRLAVLLSQRSIALRWRLFADELASKLARAHIVEPAQILHDAVRMNSTIRVRDLATNAVEIHTLAYPADADLSAGRLSVLAPLGTALLGTSAGDIVRLAGSFGRRTLRVEAVTYHPGTASAADADPAGLVPSPETHRANEKAPEIRGLLISSSSPAPVEQTGKWPAQDSHAS